MLMHLMFLGTFETDRLTIPGTVWITSEAPHSKYSLLLLSTPPPIFHSVVRVRVIPLGAMFQLGQSRQLMPLSL